jgi:hypothetical protein
MLEIEYGKGSDRNGVERNGVDGMGRERKNPVFLHGVFVIHVLDAIKAWFCLDEPVDVVPAVIFYVFLCFYGS